LARRVVTLGDGTDQTGPILDVYDDDDGDNTAVLCISRNISTHLTYYTKFA